MRMDEYRGLLMKLEYNTTYKKEKFVSDYDSEKEKDEIKTPFDNYEEKKFKDIEKIINRES